jgi:hypothetical protein
MCAKIFDEVLTEDGVTSVTRADCMRYCVRTASDFLLNYKAGVMHFNK